MRFKVGHSGHRVSIDPTWRVLDVGSGQSPFVRADVLLERYVHDDEHRAGSSVDTEDPRLVVGDALDMPFADGAFDFVVASHIAEHVEDPARLCRELTRVARAGYIETPGAIGDFLLREPFHVWRVRKHAGGLRFDRVRDPRPLGRLGDAIYALIYVNVRREGHRTFVLPSPPLGWLGALLQRCVGVALRSPVLRKAFYLEFEFKDAFPVEVRDGRNQC